MQQEILYLSPTYPGSVHDKTICREEELAFEKEVSVFTDLGFQAYTSATARIIMPHKKKKSQPLSQKQKDNNLWISKIRVRIEHVLASVKSYRIVSDVFRCRLYGKEDRVMLIACALHNLKVKSKFLINHYSI